jgi:diacylglycerol kinase (ATP)
MTASTGKRFSLKERCRSFRFAFRGIACLVRKHHNFRIHLAALALVILLGILLGLSPAEWCIVMLASGLVLSMEAVNSSLESLVDLISPDYHELAGKAKDLAAAAVLITAIFAAIAGCIIYGRHFLIFFSEK